MNGSALAEGVRGGIALSLAVILLAVLGPDALVEVDP